jgi:hypothetical protein
VRNPQGSREDDPDRLKLRVFRADVHDYGAKFRTTLNPFAPIAMNHRVGPSFVCSVLIVCFFAVALFQPDHTRSVRGRTRAVAGESIAGRRPALQASRTRTLPRRVELMDQTDGALPGSATKTARGVPGMADRNAVRRESRSAFTVVEANERMEDVALRIYGTRDESDGLWRANRDALDRKDSPLSPGMLLRTPNVSRLKSRYGNR